MILLNSCKSKSTQNISQNKEYQFIVGSYTNSTSEGIYRISFNPSLQTITLKESILGSENPSFITTNKTKTLLFSGEEVGGSNGGKVSSYRWDASSSYFKKVNSVHTLGEHTCVVALDKSEKFLLAGNYSGGNIAVFSVDEKGQLSEAIQVIQHHGKSKNIDRQEKPHIHDIVFHPNGKQVLVADLGTDRIYVYDFNIESSKPLELSAISYVKTTNGDGPRHVIFNQKADYFYVVQELTSQISTYSINEDGIKHKQNLSLLSKDTPNKKGSGAEVKISPNGKFLYVTNRGDYNEILVFEIDTKTNLLSLIQTISSGGKTPRSFEITPDGKYLISANQDSNNIVVFKIETNGKITPTNASLTLSKPTHIVNF